MENQCHAFFNKKDAAMESHEICEIVFKERSFCFISFSFLLFMCIMGMQDGKIVKGVKKLNCMNSVWGGWESSS